MNIEKFTERARGFIQAAQTIAMREGHQRLTTEHLLKALLDEAEDILNAAGSRIIDEVAQEQAEEARRNRGVRGMMRRLRRK